MPRESAELAQTQLFPDENKSTTQIQMEIIDIRNNVRRINEEIKAKQAEVNKSKNELKAITKKENDLLDIIAKRNNVEYIFIPTPSPAPAQEETQSDDGPSDSEINGLKDISQPQNAVFEDDSNEEESDSTDENTNTVDALFDNADNTLPGFGHQAIGEEIQYSQYDEPSKDFERDEQPEPEIPGDGVDLDEVLNGDESEEEQAHA